MKFALGIAFCAVFSVFGATELTGPWNVAVQFNKTNHNVGPNGLNQIFSTLFATNINGGVLADSSTTARDLSVRFGEVKNVKDGNVQGDNTTDDTANIQAVFTSATNGQTIVFPAGTYKINGYLTPPSGVTIVSLGEAWLRQTATNVPIFWSRDQSISNVVVDGMGFIGNGHFVDAVNTNGELRGEVGIWWQNTSTNYSSSGLVIKNCKFINFGASGILLQGAQDCAVVDNYIYGTGTVTYDQIHQFGIYIPGTVRRTIVQRNSITQVANGIFHGHATQNNEVDFNIIWDLPGQHGIYANALYGDSISFNKVHNTARAGIKFQTGQASNGAGAPYGGRAEGNIITDTGGDGLLLLNAQPLLNTNMMWTNFALINNTVRGWSTNYAPIGDVTNVYGIYIDHATYTQVRGNIIENRYLGFQVSACTNVVFKDNTTIRILRSAFTEGTSTDIYLINNEFLENQSSAFALSFTSDGRHTLIGNLITNSISSAQYSGYLDVSVTGNNVRLSHNIWDKPFRVTTTTNLAYNHENLGDFAGYPTGKIEGSKNKIFSVDSAPATLEAGQRAYINSPLKFFGYVGNSFGTPTEMGLMNNATFFCWDANNNTIAIGTSASVDPFRKLQVYHDGNGMARIIIENPDDDTSAAAGFSLISDGIQSEVAAFSPSYSITRWASRVGQVIDSGDGYFLELGVGQNANFNYNGGRLWQFGSNYFNIDETTHFRLKSMTNELLRADADGTLTNVTIGSGITFDGTTLSATPAAVTIETNDVTFPITDPVSTITTGLAKQYWDFTTTSTIKSVRVSIGTQSTSGGLRFDVKKNGVSIFSTTPTIDVNETSTATAATNNVLSTTAVTLNDRMTFDINEAGLGAKNAQVTIYFTTP